MPHVDMLGPFLGQVTPTSIKVWLLYEGEPSTIYLTVRIGGQADSVIAPLAMHMAAERLRSDCVTADGLSPDTSYSYRLWRDAACTEPLDLRGLEQERLCFRTLPLEPHAQIDFVVMSCHNPRTAVKDGVDGFAVWADLPQILDAGSNKSIRFALLIGDQIYADDWEVKLLAEGDPAKRLALYLEVYKAYWSNIHYRRVMCRLPSVMTWDDHDITDGWGSRIDSFEGDGAQFKPKWNNLFASASDAFRMLQATRNGEHLATGSEAGFDHCFTVGKLGFVLPDLRTHRNSRLRRVFDVAQWARIRAWIDDHRDHLDVLFFVSPVVFSHGSPIIEEFTDGIWPVVMTAVDKLANAGSWGQRLQTSFSKNVADIRDDIADSWSSKENAEGAEDVLEYLFDVQNDRGHPCSVIILSGDIHTSGYATIYSSDPLHAKRSSLPHITSSAVAYAPFNWLLEAVYRHTTKSVRLGVKGRFSSQVSHHFCSRGVAVLSLRPPLSGEEHYLKVKYYLEGYSEPQVLLFQLGSPSHRENMAWAAQAAVSEPRYAPVETQTLSETLERRAQESSQRLNWQESIVDVMKLLHMDSSLGARKRLAREWGYAGALDGSAEMNLWLMDELKRRLETAHGS